jgi:peptidoglycan/LPS O-acetylase OafA/YrhL
MSAKEKSFRHVGALDGWRGMAILLLLVGHFLPLAGINMGRIGVSLFFVLSGMLMAKLLFIDRVEIPHFYRRRLARIVPAHVVFIVVTGMAWTALDLPLLLGDLLPPLLFFNNYVLGNALQFGHIWSLSVEEHSYVVLSLVAIGARRYQKCLWLLPLLAAACAALNLRYHATYAGDELYRQLLHTEVAAYGIAVSAAICVLFARRGIPASGLLAVPLLLLGGIVLHWWSVPPAVGQLVGVAAFALAVNLLPQAARQVQALLSLQPLRQLGLWSFSLYLWQQPFYAAHLKLGLPLWQAISGALLAGLASYYLVENPARIYLNTHWSPAARPLAS